MRLYEIFKDGAKNIQSIHEDSAESIEDALATVFYRAPHLEYARKYGPEKVLDAIEYVASIHRDKPELVNINNLVREVIGVLLKTPHRQ